MTIKLDGISYQLRQPDVDGDGQTGGTETLQQSFNPNEQMITQPTELGETLKDFNSDKVDPETRMTSIDMKTRIFNTFERNSLMAIDSLVAMRFLPMRCLVITRQAKRLNVSYKGEGRKEIVELVAGKREHDKQSGMGGMFGNLGNMMSGGAGKS